MPLGLAFLDELEGAPDFEGDLTDYFCVSRAELERLAERAASAADVTYIMSHGDWWHDRAADAA